MPRPKRTDRVPHPVFPDILVSRDVAEYWKRSRAKTPEQREQEETDRRSRRTLTPKLEQIPDWQAFLQSIAPALGHTYESLRGAFECYDEAVMDGRIGATLVPIMWGRYERTYQQDDGRTRTVADYIEPEADRDIMPLVDHVLAELGRLDRTAALKSVPKAHPPASADALRKRKARAEGRMKPRPRKGPMTQEARLASREKALVTRRAKLAALHPLEISARLQCEEGIRREEKAIATLRARIQASAVAN